MKRSVLKSLLSFIGLWAFLIPINCARTDSQKGSEADLDPPISSESQNRGGREEPRAPGFVDVPKLANKSTALFDEIFGDPIKITKITDAPTMMPGEYRLYTVSGNPKGLSVRFHNDRAKRFNLLLGTPGESAKDLLIEMFKIDIDKLSRIPGGEPLSEKWEGESEGVIFKTAYAKRAKLNGAFTMVHAEIGD